MVMTGDNILIQRALVKSKMPTNLEPLFYGCDVLLKVIEKGSAKNKDNFPHDEVKKVLNWYREVNNCISILVPGEQVDMYTAMMNTLAIIEPGLRKEDGKNAFGNVVKIVKYLLHQIEMKLDKLEQNQQEFRRLENEITGLNQKVSNLEATIDAITPVKRAAAVSDIEDNFGSMSLSSTFETFTISDKWLIRSLATAILNALGHSIRTDFWSTFDFESLIANLDGHQSWINQWSDVAPEIQTNKDIKLGDCLEIAIYHKEVDSGIRLMLTKVGSYSAELTTKVEADVKLNKHAASVFVILINRSFDLLTLIVQAAIDVVDGVVIQAPTYVAVRLIGAEHAKVGVVPENLENLDELVPYNTRLKPHASSDKGTDEP